MSTERIIKVLIIEDDEFVSMVYEDQLKDASSINFETEIYQTLGEGLSAFKNHQFDVLLLDLNLPDSEYMNTINSIPEFSENIPVIIMTSTNSELLALKAVNLGGQDYLIKGNLEKSLLVRSILYAIERHNLKKELKEAKLKSDKLLNNILPVSISEELKSSGNVKAKYFDEVSVMFVDFVNFTKISSSLNPEQLVEELHICFSAFDEICANLGIEKIKTIGDAYMCVGGIPERQPGHVIHLVQAAKLMMEFIKNRYSELELQGKVFWKARAGIHVGPAVAGVVGSKKFTYDIWGDTVNTASRIESNSEPGRINLSETAYVIAKEKFNCTYRGEIEVKGKGKVKMYFLE
jgi:class 3 adenylate cyclase